MRIKVINPNTGAKIRLDYQTKILTSFASPETSLDVCCLEEGSQTIESRFDECVSSLNTLSLVKTAENEGYSGIVLTCFGNAGLDAAREITSIPVVASGLASLVFASAICQHFSIIGTLPMVKNRLENEVLKVGLERKVSSIRFINIPVSNLRNDHDKLISAIVEVGKHCIDEDGAEAIIPGCFGMIGLSQELQTALGVPVIDPAAASISLIESLVRMKLSHSKISYPVPTKKLRTVFGKTIDYL